MEVDQGEVVMFYSKELESFAWYCDTKDHINIWKQ